MVLTAFLLAGVVGERISAQLPQSLMDHARTWLPMFSALLLLAGQYLLARISWKLRVLEKEREQEHFELQGTQNLIRNLRQGRDRLELELEHLRGEQELSRAAKAHDSLDGFIGNLASVIARSLAGAQELTIFNVDERETALPRAHYQRYRNIELFIIFSNEGGALLAEAMQGEPLPARRFGVKGVSLASHNTEFHITADLGFTLPDKTRRPVGEVCLKLPRPGMDSELNKSEASNRLKAEMARVLIDATGVTEALKRPIMQRLDSRRNLLELACRLSTETEDFGIVKTAFNTHGVDVEQLCQRWKPLLSNAAGHIAAAMQSHGFQMQAIKDGMTGLFNKQYTLERLAEVFAEAAESGMDLSVIMADIDKFKNVNDTYGHITGDVIIIGVADAMAAAARAGDIVFRFGGEELGFLLAGQNARKALTLANRVRKSVEDIEFKGENGESIHCTISLGVAHYTSDMTDPLELLGRADQALYFSKEHGRNQATAYSDKLKG